MLTLQKVFADYVLLDDLTNYQANSVKVLVSHAGKARMRLMKGLKCAINALLDTLQMGQKKLKNVFCVHEVISLLSVHHPVIHALRVVSPQIHQAIVSPVHWELPIL